MVKRLKEEDHSADAIHGDLRQSKRDRVINSFRKGVKRILIATDVASRGIDVDNLSHIINYNFVFYSSEIVLSDRNFKAVGLFLLSLKTN